MILPSSTWESGFDFRVTMQFTIGTTGVLAGLLLITEDDDVPELFAAEQGE